MSDGKSRLLRDIDRILGYLLIEKECPKKLLARISGMSPNTISRLTNLEFRPDANFSPKFIVKAGESADRIRHCRADYRSYYTHERKMLLKYAQKNEPVGKEMYVDPEKVLLQQKIMYALGIADLYAGSMNGGADIYRFARELKGNYSDYEGKFFILPSNILSKKMQISPTASRPFYALTYIQEQRRMVFLDEDGKDTKPIEMRLKDENAPPVFCISGTNVSLICLEYFKRHNYDVNKELRAQIIETAIECKRHISSYCSASLAHTPHRVIAPNGKTVRML